MWIFSDIQSIIPETFLQMNKKDLYHLYLSMAICICSSFYLNHFSSTVLVEQSGKAMPWQQSWPKEMQEKKCLLALTLAQLPIHHHQKGGLQMKDQRRQRQWPSQ